MIPFADLLSAHVRDLRDEKQAPRSARPEQGEWWSMSGSMSCHRKRVIERAHHHDPERWTLGDFRTESLVVFEYGDRVEAFAREALDRWLTKNAASHHWQFPVTAPDWRARGTGDLIVEWGDMTFSGHDVKSASGKSFGWAVDKGSEGNKAQLSGYLRNWEREHPGLAVRDLASLLYLDKEYGNMAEVEFNWREIVPSVDEDYAQINREWQAFERDETLPAEIPFKASSGKDKHAQAGRARKGDMVPSGLCSPLYCRAIHHCPLVSGWWQEKTNGAS